MKALISVAVFSALMSCGPAPELKRRAFLPSTDKSTDAFALTGRTDENIIQMKYNDKIDLKCDFKIMEGSNVDLAKFKGWESSFNAIIKESQFEPFVFTFSGDRTISASIKINGFAIDHAVKTIEVDGNLYEMSYSPTADISVTIIEKATTGVLSEKTFTQKIRENVSEKIEGVTLSNDISHDLRCSVKTSIHEHYSKQWRMKGPKELN